MAKNSIRDYSATNSANTDIQSIDISEGCSPAGINNAIREVMADLKDVSTGAVALESPAMDSLTVDTTTLVVDAVNNRVGVGTASPALLTHLKSSDNTIFQLESTTPTVYMKMVDSNTTGAGYIGYVTNDMTFWANNAERMRIDSSGNVGIGTASPTKKVSANIGLNDTDGYVLEYSGEAKGGILLNPISGEVRMGALNSSGTYFTTLYANNSEAVRIDSSGNVLVGKTAGSNTTKGSTLTQTGEIVSTITTAGGGSQNIFLNRQDAYGTCIRMRYANSDVGHIGLFTGNLVYLGAGNSGLKFGADIISPSRADNGNDRDNVIDLGKSASRFDNIYATNGTIQTSDANEKQQIAALTDVEMTAAKAISQLFKTYKWNSAVEAKGDAARTHTGVIAQDVQAAMTAAGLDAGDYAFFISSTWWETQTEVPAVEAVDAVDAIYEGVVIPAVEEELDEEGNVIVEAQAERTEQRLVSKAVEAVEAVAAYTRIDTYNTAEEAPEGATERTRMGIRYPELLSFIGAATEQRLSNIETRLAALEAN